MEINKNYIIIALVVIATVLVWMNINKKDFTSGIDYDTLVDSLETQITVKEDLILNLNAQVDTLNEANNAIDTAEAVIETNEENLKAEYHEVYINFIPDATDLELDSIIRANWR